MDDKPRFVRNIRRLFLMFHRDLLANARDVREKDAAMIIKRHAEWLANRVYDLGHPESHSRKDVMTAHLKQHVDNRPLLERYLASISSQSAGSETYLPLAPQNTSKLESDDGSSDGGQSPADKIDYSKFPNLEHIQNFIV